MDIQANGLKFHCIVEGDGPLVLLLHGFPQFSYAWRHQIPPLAKHFKVVAPDLRGYGSSDRPEGVENYAMHHLTEDIVGIIKAFGYEKAHVVGHDWGGAIAWRLAQEHPEVIDKLVILNAPFPQIYLKAIRTNFSQMRKSWYLYFFQLPAIPEALFKWRSKQIVRDILQKTGAKPGTFSDEDLRKYTEALEKPGAFKATLSYYRAVARAKPIHGDGKVVVPTLVIWGEKDQALGKDLTIGLDKYLTKESKIIYLPASHWVMEEEPQQVTDLLLDFLLSNFRSK